MAKQVQWRKGTTDQHKSFVGANCEITVDTTKKTLVVHDGITPGGSVQATEKYVNDAIATIDVSSSYQSKDYIDGLDAQNVKLTGNQTISGVKTFSSNPISSAAQDTAENALTRKDYVDTLNAKNVKTTGDETIAGVKTFSSNIVGNITGNAATATKLETARNITLTGGVSGSTSFDGSGNVTISAQVNDNSHNHTSLSGTVSFNGSTGNAYNNSNIIVNGNGSTNTIKPSIGFHQKNLYAGTLSMLDGNTFQFQIQNGSPATLANHITGNAVTATRLNTTRSNYSGSTNSVVAGELMWKNYGNNHTIFDASNSTSPTGAVVSNTNPDIAWTPTYPTLMGGNGSGTFGVRVDSSRYADQLKTARTISLSGSVNGSATFDGTGDINIATSSTASSVGEYALVTVASSGAQYSKTNVAGSQLKELFFESSINADYTLSNYRFFQTGRSLTGTWFIQGTISNSAGGNTGTRVAYAKRIA